MFVPFPSCAVCPQHISTPPLLLQPPLLLPALAVETVSNPAFAISGLLRCQLRAGQGIYFPTLWEEKDYYCFINTEKQHSSDSS